MRRQGKMVEALVQQAQRSGEDIPGLPLVEIGGDRRVLIENHRGVTEYRCDLIRVKVAFGRICVCGSGLRLARMTRHQLVICGRIDSVSLERG